MSRYVAFLRGINVGGRRATSDQLCSCLSEIGFEDVATFRASGNVIFGARHGAGDDEPDRTADGDAPHREAELAARVEQAMLASLGFEVPVFLRPAAEVRAIAAYGPFPADVVQASAGKLQVLLLAAKPEPRARKEALALATDEDRLALRGRELYWLPSGGMMESALDMNAIGALLGLGTMRTKGTVEQIAMKYCAG
jgi:uncharacterized protein (DUF1697 family)